MSKNADEVNAAYVKTLPEYATLSSILISFFTEGLEQFTDIPKNKIAMKAEQMLHKWLITYNVALGGHAPLDMILNGNGDILVKFIKKRLGIS